MSRVVADEENDFGGFGISDFCKLEITKKVYFKGKLSHLVPICTHCGRYCHHFSLLDWWKILISCAKVLKNVGFCTGNMEMWPNHKAGMIWAVREQRRFSTLSGSFALYLQNWTYSALCTFVIRIKHNHFSKNIFLALVSLKFKNKKLLLSTLVL